MKQIRSYMPSAA